MREDDEKPTEQGRNRTIRSLTGLVFAIGGILFAIFCPDQAKLGFLVALLGAGVIEPTQISGLLRK